MIPSFNNIPKWLWWILAFPLAFLYGWLILILFNYFQPLINIFITSLILTFLLDYPVNFLQRKKVTRQNAVILVFLITIVLILALTFTLAPIISEQLNELVKRLPLWLDSSSLQLQGLNNWAITRRWQIDLSGIGLLLASKLSEQAQDLMIRMLGLILDSLSNVFNIFLTAVLTFYLLLNGQQVWDGIFQWFPADMSLIIRRSLRQNFHNYFIGQISLAAISGVTITLAFLVLQVPLGLLFGFCLGLTALFPLLTTVGIGLVSLLVGLQNFWLGIKVLITALTIDQINVNFIAPRILGGLTGLNPVWIILSLLLGARLGGILGLFIAVPVASFIKNIAETFRTK